MRFVIIHEHERGRNTEWVRVDTKASKSRLKASESRIDLLYQPTLPAAASDGVGEGTTYGNPIARQPSFISSTSCARSLDHSRDPLLTTTSHELTKRPIQDSRLNLNLKHPIPSIFYRLDPPRFLHLPSATRAAFGNQKEGGAGVREGRRSVGRRHKSQQPLRSFFQVH